MAGVLTFLHMSGSASFRVFFLFEYTKDGFTTCAGGCIVGPFAAILGAKVAISGSMVAFSGSVKASSAGVFVVRFCRSVSGVGMAIRRSCRSNSRF